MKSIISVPKSQEISKIVSLFEMTGHGGLAQYTRWTSRLSHQTSDLSHPCNLLPKGCDPFLAQYQFQGDAGSDLPS